MASQNFTDFTLKVPASGDFLVGYNADGSNEFKTTVNALVSSYATNTALNAASSVLLPTSVYRAASASFATNTALNAASSVLLPTSVYNATSGSFTTRSFTDSKYLPLSTTDITFTNLTATNAFISNLTATNLTSVLNVSVTSVSANASDFLVTSTGSLSARTLADRFGERVNVLDFGADPKGIDDSTAAIQAANDYARANQSGYVYFPGGSYRITSTLIWGTPWIGSRGNSVPGGPTRGWPTAPTQLVWDGPFNVPFISMPPIAPGTTFTQLTFLSIENLWLSLYVRKIVSISNLTWSGGVVTVTTTEPHNAEVIFF